MTTESQEELLERLYALTCHAYKNPISEPWFQPVTSWMKLVNTENKSNLAGILDEIEESGSGVNSKLYEIRKREGIDG